MRINTRVRHAPWRPLVLALVAAVALGLVGRVAVHAGSVLPHGGAIAAVGHTAVALGAPWLAIAWLLGAAAGSQRAGAGSGAAALVLGTGAWYVLSVTTGAPASYAAPVAVAWGAVALGAGASFGFAGATWRRGEPRARAASVALLAGALAGEALLLMSEWSGRAAVAVLGAELVAAAALLLGARRRAPVALTLAFFLVATVAVFQAESLVREALRLTGWAGP